ncbi:MAG: sigma-70 family RNA polymerase sigma factor [Phycisphaerae bacterium]|nr:sigma-70 family RNA polymerase sigma factor [Phycisphaerae bacterium]
MAGANKNFISVEQYLTLLTENHRRIYSYIFNLVGNFDDTDDIMQETTLVMWRKHYQFEQGTDFLAWATTVAHYQVLSYRQKRKRDKDFIFSEKTLHNLQVVSRAASGNVEDRLNALEICLKKLDDNDRNLIQMRYRQEISVKEIAYSMKRTVQSIYIKIGRIQGSLLRCVQRSLEEI